jgi:hypothetical protein
MPLRISTKIAGVAELQAAPLVVSSNVTKRQKRAHDREKRQEDADAAKVEHNRAAVVTLHHENNAIATQENTMMEISILQDGTHENDNNNNNDNNNDNNDDNISSIGNQIEGMNDGIFHETDPLDYDELIRMYRDTVDTDPFWTLLFDFQDGY